MKKKPTTAEEIEILIAILPHVVEKLTLNGWDLTVQMKKSLKAAIDKMTYRVKRNLSYLRPDVDVLL